MDNTWLIVSVLLYVLGVLLTAYSVTLEWVERKHCTPELRSTYRNLLLVMPAVWPLAAVFCGYIFLARIQYIWRSMHV